MMIKLNDYMPLPVRRTIVDKDYRHIAQAALNGDFSKNEKVWFDSTTGKAL